MHICYIADARSPIAKNWISHFIEAKHRVTVISSYPCGLDEIPGAQIIEFPFALSSLSRVHNNGRSRPLDFRLQKMIGQVYGAHGLAASVRLRSWIAPFAIRRKKATLQNLLNDLRPDLVHAMRLPFEGFLAASVTRDLPLVISIWGNDFTLFADRDRRIDRLTRSALARADALHCDCNRDLRTAFTRGYSEQKPWRVLPGNGGIQCEYFGLHPDSRLLRRFDIPEGRPLIINPRGLRAYVRNDSFFRAIPLVLRHFPNTFFLATGMAGNPLAERWTRRMRVASSVCLLPTISRHELSRLFATCEVSVSPTSHDGTPNTLLESMACGCFPITGRVDSLREWITDGENGFICNESDPESLASAIVRALRNPALRAAARSINRELVRSRAEYAASMLQAEALYGESLGVQNRRR